MIAMWLGLLLLPMQTLESSWGQPFGRGVIVGLLIAVVIDLLDRYVVRPLWRRWRASRVRCQGQDTPEPQGAPDAGLMPRFGQPDMALYNPQVHGAGLRCSSGETCKGRVLYPGEAFFLISEATEGHPTVAVCCEDVVLRDGALISSRSWYDMPMETPATMHRPAVDS